MASNRTEKPTPKRRREAREKGRAARSRDLASAIVFLNAVLALGVGGAYLLGQMQQTLYRIWSESLLLEINPSAAKTLAEQSVISVMKLAAPIVLLTVVVAFGASILQSGLLISSHNLKPKISGLSPKNNLKKIFSGQGLAQLLKSILLIVVLTWIAYDSVSSSMPRLASLALTDIRGGTGILGGLAFSILFKAGGVLAVLGLADFAFQKYQFEKSLKQTKQEVKEDLKHTEGNPLVKGRIRRLQREMARRRMMAAVPEADVVVTNPTQFAVAVKYEAASMSAPQVVAKGRGLVAARIRDIAESHGVPIVENVGLAQALYKTVEIGAEIPAALFKTVAQVLAYVYKLREENWH